MVRLHDSILQVTGSNPLRTYFSVKKRHLCPVATLHRTVCVSWGLAAELPTVVYCALA